MDYLSDSLSALNEWLIEPAMVEIAVNPDGKIWVLRRGDIAMVETGKKLEANKITGLIQQMAAKTHAKVGNDKLLISGSVVYNDRSIRAQGLLAPAVHGGKGAIALRLHSSLDIGQIQLNYLHGKSQSMTEMRTKKMAELDDLIAGSRLMEALEFCVANRLNILIAGGTDTGKTVALRKIISLIDEKDRIITIEDAAELYPGQPNCVSLIADRGSEIRSTDRLLEASLRMRPDRLIVGEIRGKEAMTFLEAINTGHGGSMSTIHAETPELALDRLAIAAARSGVPMTYENLLDYIGRTIDVIIQAGRKGADRGIVEIYRPDRRAA
ncbi:type II secretion system protein E [Ochrobactrum sp. XJ1]|nr:type II secretion system protein E [Ochrobactrum sp. XJ1]